MRPVDSAEIVGLAAYARVRDRYRQQIIDYKRQRRMDVGEQITLVFENRETVRFQIQEMLWVERISRPAAVAAEVAVYNELVPGEGELSATLLIEITEPGRIRAELERLVGISEHVFLVLGEGPGERALRASFDTRQLEDERISAVHYIRFALGDAERGALADASCRARVRITHPQYRREDEIPPRLRACLVEDLAREPAALLARDPAEPAEPVDDLVFELGGARALRPARPGFEGHLIVELAGASPELLEAGPGEWAALWPALQRAARDVGREHGAAVIAADAAPGAPLRVHVYAPRRAAG